MAMVRVRHASMYISGKKVAELFDNNYDIASGDEPLYGDEGFAGMSDGAPMTTLDCTTIVPVGGMSVKIEKAMLAKQNVDIALGVVDGDIHQLSMRVVNASFKSDAKAGTLIGSFKFMGGPPVIA